MGRTERSASMDAIDLGLLFIHRLLTIHTERTSAVSPQLKEFLDQQLFAPLVRKRNYISIIIEGMRDRDIYHLTDPLGVRVSLVRIGDELCLLGPYITGTLSISEIKKRFAENRIDEKHLTAFQDYLITLPFLSADSMEPATHTLLQGAVGMNSRALVYYVNLTESEFTRLRAESAGTPVSFMAQQVYESVVNANENISLLYQLETTLAEQMSNGNTADALTTLARINTLHRHGKQEEDLETVKLESAILYAQMRQTAIRAGVLPTVAEVRCRYFLTLIRSSNSLKEAEKVRNDMLAQFCDIIRKERLGSLSPKVRQIVQFVMADLSGDLSVDILAAQVNLSPNYLSSFFKKEMGQSLSSFIRDKRLESAAHFLSFTNMPIHDISICVGITDFSYFTKIFREKYGETPSVYRHHKL